MNSTYEVHNEYFDFNNAYVTSSCTILNERCIIYLSAHAFLKLNHSILKIFELLFFPMNVKKKKYIFIDTKIMYKS